MSVVASEGEVSEAGRLYRCGYKDEEEEEVE